MPPESPGWFLQCPLTQGSADCVVSMVLAVPNQSFRLCNQLKDSFSKEDCEGMVFVMFQHYGQICTCCSLATDEDCLPSDQALDPGEQTLLRAWKKELDVVVFPFFTKNLNLKDVLKKNVLCCVERQIDVEYDLSYINVIGIKSSTYGSVYEQLFFPTVWSPSCTWCDCTFSCV